MKFNFILATVGRPFEGIALGRDAGGSAATADKPLSMVIGTTCIKDDSSYWPETSKFVWLM
jgi:hypothetical protein